MTIARTGVPLIAIVLFLTIVLYGIALQRRSWSIWLVAFGLTVVSLLVAWLAREPVTLDAALAGLTSLAELPRA